MSMLMNYYSYNQNILFTYMSTIIGLLEQLLTNWHVTCFFVSLFLVWPKHEITATWSLLVFSGIEHGQDHLEVQMRNGNMIYNYKDIYIDWLFCSIVQKTVWNNCRMDLRLTESLPHKDTMIEIRNPVLNII